jgi:hypothetical protein
MNYFKRYNQWEQPLNESKVATDVSPLGYYTIANALMPTQLFNELRKLNIEYRHDRYANFIELFVSDLDEASFVRSMILSDIFEADDIEDADLPYMVTDRLPDDALEIKLKKV